MNKEKRRVPKLRFPGFTEDWEQRKLGDYLSIPEKEILEVASSDDLITVKLNLGGVELGASRDTLSLGSTVYYKRYAGQFIYGKQNFFNGSMGLIPTNLDGKGSSGDVPSFNVSNIEENYLYTYVSRESYWRSKEAAASGTGSKRIHEKTFLDFNIDVPSMEEQKLISNTFDLIDRFITLHQRKLEYLNLKKKALLQKLFPKNGERYPELRFPGFTDAWEQRKLGDFTNQINTFVNPEDAKLPLWSLTAEAGLIEKSDRYERDFLVKKKDQFKRIETNTLVYNPMNITIGSIDIYTGLYPIAVSGYYVSIVYDKNIDTDFLKEVLLLPSSLKMYKNYATGSLIERQRVQYPTFSKLQLLLPNLDEQKAIGQLFKSLNLNITLHQRKLEHLQLQKKALLQQMFV